jgi:hypothetical protein
VSFCIALLGAPRTGKTTLAQALARGLEQAQVGPVVLVPDPALAAQTQATAQGLQTAGPQGWVVIDNPALGQTGANPFADAAAPWPDLMLLMGLDLPGATHPDVDQAIRQRVLGAPTPLHTVYGEGTDREQAAWQALLARLGPGHAALNAIENIAAHAYSESARRLKSLQFKPVCENCGNAECEHRLFQQLIAGRR